MGRKRNEESSQSSSQKSKSSPNDSKSSRSPNGESDERSSSEDERRSRSSVGTSSEESSPQQDEQSPSDSSEENSPQQDEQSPSDSSNSASPRRADSRDSRASSQSRNDSSRSGSQSADKSSRGSSASQTPREDSPLSSDSPRAASGSGSSASDDRRRGSHRRGSSSSERSRASQDSRDSRSSESPPSPDNERSPQSSSSKAGSSGSGSPSLSESEGSQESSQASTPPPAQKTPAVKRKVEPPEPTYPKQRPPAPTVKPEETTVENEKSKEPAILPKESSGAQQIVSFSMKVNNVLHSALMSNATLLASFTAGVKESIAEQSGSGVFAEHVDVRLFPGSVVVQASVSVPRSVAAESVRSNLESPHAGFQNLVDKVKALPGINAISTGPIRVSEISQPKVSEKAPPKKLENGQFEVVAEASDKSLGFTTNREQRRELVYTLDHGSWADKVGIRVYDELVKVNGNATQALQARDLFTSLQRRPVTLVMMPTKAVHTTMKIVMIGCYGLRKVARMGESRIFCTCDFSVTRGEPVEKQLQITTPSISGSRSPKWFYTSEVAYDETTKSLKFNVWDQDNVAKDLLGKVILPQSKFSPNGFDGELVLQEAGIGAVLKVRVEIVKHEARLAATGGVSDDMAAQANLEAIAQMRERAQKELEEQLEQRIHDKEVQLKAENRVLELQIKELQAKLVAAELAKAKEANREQEHEQRMAFARKEVLMEQQHKKAMQEKEAEIRVFKSKLIEAEATALALKRSAAAVLQQPANEALVKAQQRRAEQEIDELKIRLAQAELGLQNVKESMEHEAVPMEVQTSPRLIEKAQPASEVDHEMEMLRIKLAQAEASLKAMPLAAKNATATASAPSMLKVEVVSARGLQKAGSTREIDTYCTCEVLPRKLGIRLRTKTLKGKSKPEWNHSDEFRFDDDITMLKFTVWHDSIAGATSLGVAGLARSRFDLAAFSGELPLQDGGPDASLMVKVERLSREAPKSKPAVTNPQFTRPPKITSEGKPALTRAEKAERRKIIQQTRNKIRESEMARIEEEYHQQENEKAVLDEERHKSTPRSLQILQKLEMEEDDFRRQLRADKKIAQASYDSAQREEAAAKIQAARRASLARSKVERMRQARDDQWKKEQRQRERDAVNQRLQALQEAKEIRGKEQAAATMIQAGFRGMSARRSVALMIEELGNRRYSQVHESHRSSPSPRFHTGAGSCGNYQPQPQRHAPAFSGSGPSSGRAPATRPEALRSAGYPASGGGGHLPGPGAITPPSVVPIMPIAGGTASFSDPRVPIGRGSPAVGSGVVGPPQSRHMVPGPPTGGSIAASQQMADTAGESVFQPATRNVNAAGRLGPPDRIQRSEAIQHASETRRGGGAGHAIFNAR